MLGALAVEPAIALLAKLKTQLGRGLFEYKPERRKRCGRQKTKHEEPW